MSKSLLLSKVCSDLFSKKLKPINIARCASDWVPKEKETHTGQVILNNIITNIKCLI